MRAMAVLLLSDVVYNTERYSSTWMERNDTGSAFLTAHRLGVSMNLLHDATDGGPFKGASNERLDLTPAGCPLKRG